MKNAPRALRAMPAVRHQESHPVHVGGIQGLGRNGGLNMELHYRSRFSPRDRFLVTYSSHQSSAARQYVGAEFLGLHHASGDPANLKLWASNEDDRTP
jgi:hypothetical protein